MARFVKVGSVYINMDRITEARPRTDGDGREVFAVMFGVDDYTNLRGIDADALERYICGQAFDVSAWYAGLSARERIAPEPT